MLKEKIFFWFNAIFYILFGGFMLFKPEMALVTIIIIFGIESILSGITGVILAIKDKEFEERGILAGVSIFQILVGVLLIAFPDFAETIIKIFVALIGISIIIKGVLLLIDSFQLKKARFQKWWWSLVAGCLLVLLGLFLTLNSLLAVFIINGVIGLGLIIVGISMIIWVLQLKKEIKREFEA